MVNAGAGCNTAGITPSLSRWASGIEHHHSI